MDFPSKGKKWYEKVHREWKKKHTHARIHTYSSRVRWNSTKYTTGFSMKETSFFPSFILGLCSSSVYLPSLFPFWPYTYPPRGCFSFLGKLTIFRDWSIIISMTIIDHGSRGATVKTKSNPHRLGSGKKKIKTLPFTLRYNTEIWVFNHRLRK